MKSSQALDRVLGLLGIKDILELLSTKLSWTDLQTLMLYVYEMKVRTLSPADVLKNYEGNRLSEISGAEPREMLKIDALLYNSIPQCYFLIELSPVNPIGANAVLSTIDPKVSLATIRSVEVVSDHGMSLALECARIRKNQDHNKDSQTEVHLAASHRPLRTQKFANGSGLSSHFRSFAMVSAAKDTKGFNSFELEALSGHISTWLDVLLKANTIGYSVGKISVVMSDMRLIGRLVSDNKISRDNLVNLTKDSKSSLFEQSGIDLPREVESASSIPLLYPELETCINELRFSEEKLVLPIRERYPSVNFSFNLERSAGIGYYSGLCYKLTAETLTGMKYSLAGGGATDWTKKLLQNKRERLISSGFGSEVFQKFFKII